MKVSDLQMALANVDPDKDVVIGVLNIRLKDGDFVPDGVRIINYKPKMAAADNVIYILV